MYEHYQGFLRGIAFRNGIPRSEIDDMIQETFIAYFEYYPVCWNEAQKKAALSRILKNKVVDYHRKDQDVFLVSLDTEEGLAETESYIYKMNDRQMAEAAEIELSRDLVTCISGMKLEWKEAVFRYGIFGEPSEEICEDLGLTGTAFRSRLYRARKFIKNYFAKDSG
ncbi:MAG: RNA polymerase sigma factor [Lachnospiraceae bacterium]